MAKNAVKELLKIFDEEFLSYLSNMSIGIQKTILDRFNSEKDVDNKPFASLKQSTKDSRRKKYGETPILKRTRNLRNSIKVVPDFDAKNLRIDSLEYGEHLNDGRSNMKPRRIMEFPKEWATGGRERKKSFSKASIRIEERFKDFIDIYKNR